MKTRTLFILFCLLCWFAKPLIADEPLSISLIQLIANPKDYDGKIVRVIGFVRLEFEGNAIYLHQEDYKQRLSKNGLWIDVTAAVFKKEDDFDQKYVLLEGTFNAKMTGHMSLWSGSIQKITRAQVWSEKLTTRDPSLDDTTLDSWGRQKDFFIAKDFEIIPWARAKTIMLEGKIVGGKQYHNGWITLYGPAGEKLLTRLAEHDDIYIFFKEHNLKLKGFGTE